MVTPQQYNLRWNNHTNNLIQVFAEHYEKEEMVDVTLSCEGKFLKAHKIVLGACSPYFQEIFNRHGNTQHPIIILNGYRFEEVRLIVEFMYQGEVKVSDYDLESLLAASESLQVKGLSNIKTTHNSHSSKSPPPALYLSSSVGNGNLWNGLPQNIINIKTMSNQIKTEQQEVPLSATPLHLKRKRVKSSVKKEVKENSHLELQKVKDISSSHTSPSVNDADTDVIQSVMKIKLGQTFKGIDEENDMGISRWEAYSKGSDGFKSIIDSKECRLGGKGSPSVSDISLFPGGTGSGMVEPKEKIPRPPNAFMIFANEYRRKLATQFPNESNKEISVRLGVMWKNLATKEDYYTASRQANDEHKKKYPDYYYSPKEARMRKNWKLQQQQQQQLNQPPCQYNPMHLVKVLMNEEAGDQNGPTNRSPSY